MRTEAQIDAIYRERSERFARERDGATARARRLEHARLATFLAVIVPFVLPLPPTYSTGLIRAASALLFVAVFVALVLQDNRARRLRRRYAVLVSVNDEARSRLARDWDAVPENGPVPATDEHLYAEDLDIFGHASLFKLLGSVSTPSGRATLIDWLLAPAGPEEIRDRQAAATDLAPRLELREELAARGRLLSGKRAADVDGLLSWAEGAPWLGRRRWLIWTAYVLPMVTLTLIALNAKGVLGYYWWFAALSFGLVLTYTKGREIHRIFDRAFAREAKFREYAELFRMVSATSFDAPRLLSIQSDLTAAGLSAHQQMARLNRLRQLADARFNLLYVPLQALTLWDIHVLGRLERWQRVAGPHARGWLTALGELDALSALASLKHDNPDWAFPEVTDEAQPVLDASGLGHPLLRRDVRVANDVRVGPAGTFLLVTGSNMSGKSTLLRAIGANVVLACAGGPVCASSMRLPPVTLRTDMRVYDSLEHGLSQFMAELERLKRVVAAAHEIRRDGRHTLLYLLDDMLQGTNSAERQIAARRIIQHLLAAAAIGAVTTHDLALADTEELSSAGRPVHFTETLSEGPDGPQLSFDYRLRPGIATSRNALKLLEIVGLDSSDT